MSDVASNSGIGRRGRNAWQFPTPRAPMARRTTTLRPRAAQGGEGVGGGDYN